MSATSEQRYPHEFNTFQKDPEPWPEAVEGAVVLDELRAAFQRYVALPLHADVLLALWVLHTHAIDAASTSPILAITSPTKRCGKTTLLEVLASVVKKPCAAANVTTSAIFRIIEQYAPTLLIDEADTFLESRDIIGILNSGHSRATAGVLRNTVAKGEDWTPKLFRTWAAKAIAMIGALPHETLRDRSIEVRMARRKDKIVQPFRSDSQQEMEVLRRKAWRFACDNVNELRAARPVIPEILNDRAADSWEPLFAIADRAGGEWPELARDASFALSARNADTHEQPDAIQLLLDIREYYEERCVDRARTEDLLGYLNAMHERPWATIAYGRKCDGIRLARMLKPFGICSTKIRVNSTQVFQGYIRADFVNTWSVYLEPEHLEHQERSQTLDVQRNRNTVPCVPEHGQNRSAAPEE